MIPGKKIRVLVVDDSLLARSMITKGLSAHPRIEIVGFAINTLDARRKIPALNPDVEIGRASCRERVWYLV